MTANFVRKRTRVCALAGLISLVVVCLLRIGVQQDPLLDTNKPNGAENHQRHRLPASSINVLQTCQSCSRKTKNLTSRLLTGLNWQPWARAYWYRSLGKSIVLAVLLRRVDPSTISGRGQAGLKLRHVRCSIRDRPDLESAATEGYWAGGNFGSYKWEAVGVICSFISTLEDKDWTLLVDEIAVPVFEVPSWNYSLTVCMESALHERVSDRWVGTWMDFYAERWAAEHFFVYTSVGMRIPTNRPHTIVNVSDQMHFNTHYFAQNIVMHDCLYLNAALGTKWTLFVDADELVALTASNPFSNRWQDFLIANSDKDGVTFGSWSYVIGVCRETGDNHLAVPYRTMQPECRPDIKNFAKKDRIPSHCLDYQGRRKFAVQPRRLKMLRIHNPDITNRLLHLNTTDGVIHHYQSAQTHTEFCTGYRQCQYLSEPDHMCMTDSKHAGLRFAPQSPIFFHTLKRVALVSSLGRHL